MLADAAYGTDTQFREAIRSLGLPYVVGIMSSVSVWKPGEAPLSKRKWKGMGQPHQAVATRQPPSAGSGQRPGAQSAGFGLEDRDLAARDKNKVFVRASLPYAFGLRIATIGKAEPRPEEWLLLEWPRGDAEPTKYWLSTLPADTTLSNLVRISQTALDHRARLPGAKARTRLRAF